MDGIATVVAVAQDHFSGHHVELVGGPDAHHDRGRFTSGVRSSFPTTGFRFAAKKDLTPGGQPLGAKHDVTLGVGGRRPVGDALDVAGSRAAHCDRLGPALGRGEQVSSPGARV